MCRRDSLQEAVLLVPPSTVLSGGVLGEMPGGMGGGPSVRRRHLYMDCTGRGSPGAHCQTSA